MSTLAIKFEPLAVEVGFTDTMLRVVLADGREISSPLAWFPRLLNATPEQRRKWRLIGGGIGIHWESVDEDVAVESVLAVSNPSVTSHTPLRTIFLRSQNVTL
jgi:hypothetical protein